MTQGPKSETLPEALIAFVSDYPRLSVREIAGELEDLGKHGAAWPRATANHWKREIEKLIERGELVEVDGVVKLPVVTDDRPKQMTLF